MENKPKTNKKEILRAFISVLNLTFKANKVAFVGLAIYLSLVSILPFAINYLDSRVIDEIVHLLGVNKEDRFFSTLIFFVVAVILLNITEKIAWALFALAEKSHYFSINKMVEMMFLQKVSELDMYHFEDNNTHNLIQKVREMYNYKPANVANRFI